MHFLRNLFWIAGIFACTATATAASPYSRVYAFGDSYSDTGAGYPGSDDQTAVAYLAQRLGAPFTHAKDPDAGSRGINFAVSGAATGANPGRRIGDAWLVVGMQNQVDDFVSRVHRGEIAFDPETTLFFIAGGLNDRDVPTRITTDNLARMIERLRDAGARHVSLSLLPTRIPAFRREGKRLNPAYRRLVPALRGKLGIDLALNGLGVYLDDILAHPSRYGIADTQSRCAGYPPFGEALAPCATPADHFYYYDAHPSAAVHRHAADKLFAEIAGDATAAMKTQTPAR